jgi:hypothetical protein
MIERVQYSKAVWFGQEEHYLECGIFLLYPTLGTSSYSRATSSLSPLEDLSFTGYFFLFNDYFVSFTRGAKMSNFPDAQVISLCYTSLMVWVGNNKRWY